jgi:hypothetical protein
LGKRAKVSAGEETRWFCAAHDQGMNGGFTGNAVESGVDIGEELVVENVDGPAGNVDPQNGDSIRLLIDAQRRGLEKGHAGILD